MNAIMGIRGDQWNLRRSFPKRTTGPERPRRHTSPCALAHHIREMGPSVQRPSDRSRRTAGWRYEAKKMAKNAAEQLSRRPL